MRLRLLILLTLGLFSSGIWAQLKPRPDAFPPQYNYPPTKSVQMATTLTEMADWDRYPTYPLYLEMMRRWAQEYPALCRVDTIGLSVNGRLILALEMSGDLSNTTLPQFFYSSTIHGDEVTGYVMLLRLIDTLLSGYGANQYYTRLLDSTFISINPLANPDGTYHSGDLTVQNATRENACRVDLNRNYPDPFRSGSITVQPENEAMIAYVSRRHFRLSANLHGGAEVLNYPWDSFRSSRRSHPAANWWIEVCRRFIDTSRVYNNNHFLDTYSCGYTAGGDWYVIPNGRQDYMNYYHNCLEMTMEISTDKTLDAAQLPAYWQFLQAPMVNYIAEIHSLPPDSLYLGMPIVETDEARIVVRQRCIEVLDGREPVHVYDLMGREVGLHVPSAGIYLVRVGERCPHKVVVL